MCYVITDSKNYINLKGGVHIVNSLDKATKLKKSKADNVFKCLPKTFDKNIWEVQYTEAYYGNVKLTPEVKELKYNLLEEVYRMETFARDLKERSLYLNSKLSRIDLEIIDIRHAARFYTLNASQGYKLYKMLHDAENERGRIKDEIEKIGYVLKGTMLTALNSNISKSIVGMADRKYTPRVLKELFGV